MSEHLPSSNHPPAPRLPHATHPAHPQHPQHAPHSPPSPARESSGLGLGKTPALPITSIKKPAVEQAQISLVEESETTTGSKIRAFGVAGMHAHKAEFKRQPAVTGAGAIRIRTFHGRLSDEGLVFMDDKINEWLDTHPEIEIKFVTSTVGLYEGKIKEPALILNVWY